MRHDRDLVLPTDRGKDGPNIRVAEGRVEVSGPVLRAGADPAGRRVLDRDESGDRG